ncbi:xanthine dehydrogenase family protein molybdopterin-binding subunit [Deltaproteobacteria bacterium]|nr:xanthine dehydrogenase family protein molybdopterin-binding subunit [Deltaproteobacteria bacterium]
MARGYRHIGKASPRKDAHDIVTGRAEYIDDMKLPDILYGKVLRSPYSHANIKTIDTERARSMPGVRAILTYRNCPDWKGGTPPHVKVLDKKVRFLGDGVAVIAADSQEQATEALDEIIVEYEPLEPVYDVEEAIGSGAPQLYDEFPGNRITDGFPSYGPECLKGIVLGDVKKGFEEADYISEGAYGYEMSANPLPLEPPGVIARWDSHDRLTIWSATQSAGWHRFLMLPLIGFHDIRSIATHCGGSFGSKNYSLMPCFYAAALAKAANRPVKIYYSKEEQFGAFVLRPGSRFKGKVGLKKDGSVTAVSGEWFFDTGAFADVPQAQVAVGCGELQLMLRCPNWNISTSIVCTNHSPSGVVRGFGGQELESAFLPLLFEAMEKLDVDPVSFYKKNYVKPGDGYYWRDGKHYFNRGIDYSKAMDKGAEAFDWMNKWKGWLRPTSADGTMRIGVGVGIHGNADVGEDVSEAYVRLTPDGRATVHVCVSESGTGQRSSLCKMVAEVLKIPVDDVNMAPPDTLVNPFEFGLVGSRGTYPVGSAVIGAADEAKKELLDQASQVLEVPSKDLDTCDGKVFVRKNPEKSVSWSRIIGIVRTCTGFARYEEDFSITNFIMLFVEVEVDIETGKIALRQVTGATDVGRIIDPLTLKGQMHGCFGSAGLDTAIFEETVMDRNTGHMLNPNLIDYKWRAFPELPPFRDVIMETHMPTHRFGAVGVGEITTAPGPGAVLMAVSNAIGIRMTEYPLTPERILNALKTRGNRTE